MKDGAGFDAASAFFEPVLEPRLKALFIARSSGSADNGPVFLRPPPSLQAAPRRAAAAAFVYVLGLALAIALAAFAAPSAWAARKGDHDHNHDHDRARAAVLAGEVLPLPTLLERLQRTHPGRVLELELEFDDDHEAGTEPRPGPEPATGRKPGRWIVEVKLLQADGQLLKLEVDAATAQVLKVKRESARKRGRGRDRPEPPRTPGEAR